MYFHSQIILFLVLHQGRALLLDLAQTQLHLSNPQALTPRKFHLRWVKLLSSVSEVIHLWKLTSLNRLEYLLVWIAILLVQTMIIIIFKRDILLVVNLVVDLWCYNNNLLLLDHAVSTPLVNIDKVISNIVSVIFSYF